MDLYTAIGLGGVAFYVGSYGLVQIGRMDGNGAPYSAMNVIAASMVFVSLLQDFNLASMVTQVTWITIGVGGLLLRVRRSRQAPNQIAEEAAGTKVVRPSPAATGSPQMGNAPVVRVRPIAPRGNVESRPTFDLRPDTAPARTGRSTLGIQPDLAPAN